MVISALEGVKRLQPQLLQIMEIAIHNFMGGEFKLLHEKVSGFALMFWFDIGEQGAEEGGGDGHETGEGGGLIGGFFSDLFDYDGN